MPIDPQVEGLLNEMAAMGGPPIHELSVADARLVAEGMSALSGDPIEVAAVDNITIPVDGAEIAARVYTPDGDGPHPVVMFFHGGGWVICSLDTHDNVARAICRDAEAVVVSVDYRMAPEHRFPTAAHDCFALGDRRNGMVHEPPHHRCRKGRCVGLTVAAFEFGGYPTRSLRHASTTRCATRARRTGMHCEPAEFM